MAGECPAATHLRLGPSEGDETADGPTCGHVVEQHRC